VSRAQIPNLLTVLRLVLAAAFFVVLNQYRVGAGPLWVLPLATVLFIAAAVTDAFDGYLARKWQVVSLFGRIVDPLADKVLVLGALIYLAGPRFQDPATLTQVSGVVPWMVVVIFTREMLVTSIRGAAEGLGVDFSAQTLGKWKMILQSVVVPVVLAIVAVLDLQPEWTWLGWVRDVLVWVTVAVTVLSGWPYIAGARRLVRTG
jgi:CDP-diacylglycerol---glycerol-3-phosphate 3-phosphatidyltransferase